MSISKSKNIERKLNNIAQEAILFNLRSIFLDLEIDIRIIINSTNIL